MPTIANLYDDMRASIKRGATFDSSFEGAARRAVDFIEKDYTFYYMMKYRFLSTDYTADYPTRLTLPDRVKSVVFLRQRYDDNTLNYLKMYREDSDFENDLTNPQGYTLSEGNVIVLDSLPQNSNINLEIYYSKYTEWPSNTAFEPDILKNNEAYLLAQAMIELFPIVKDPAIASIWGPISQAKRQAAIDSDIELRESNRLKQYKYEGF